VASTPAAVLTTLWPDLNFAVAGLDARKNITVIFFRTRIIADEPQAH
jgi:hypothetical protein